MVKVEVVRCKDCKYREPMEIMYSIGFKETIVTRWGCKHMPENEGYDFCSYGEERENGTE